MGLETRTVTVEVEMFADSAEKVATVLEEALLSHGSVLDFRVVSDVDTRDPKAPPAE